MEREYKTYPNQKVVVVKKEKTDKNNLYATININALQDAMNDLANEYTAFKLWLYFAKNQDNHSFAFSIEDCVKNWGFKRRSIYDALNTLEERGYLKQKSGNVYVFCENRETKVRQSPTYTEQD